MTRFDFAQRSLQANQKPNACNVATVKENQLLKLSKSA